MDKKVKILLDKPVNVSDCHFLSIFEYLKKKFNVKTRNNK